MALMRITVLISGRGSNMAALIDACIAGRIEGAVTHVISNRPDVAVRVRDEFMTTKTTNTTE